LALPLWLPPLIVLPVSSPKNLVTLSSGRLLM